MNSENPPSRSASPSRSRAFAWIAIGLSAVGLVVLLGLHTWSQTRAAWDVIGGGAFATGALVLSILAIRRRATSESRALPITALALAIAVALMVIGGANVWRESAAEARACAERDNAWIDEVTPALVTYRSEVLRLDKKKPTQFADQTIRASARAVNALIALGATAAAKDPCDPRIRPYNEAMIEAGTLATTMKLAGEAVLAEPTSQRLVDRWGAASDRVAAAEERIAQEGLRLSASVVRERTG